MNERCWDGDFSSAHWPLQRMYSFWRMTVDSLKFGHVAALQLQWLFQIQSLPEQINTDPDALCGVTALVNALFSIPISR